MSCTIPNFKLGYDVPSQIRAGIPCIIPEFELEYCVLSQGMYWYILAQIRDRGPGFGPLGQCRPLAVSTAVPI